MMDSESLATLLAVHRSGSVTAAAAALHRSQPAISRRLALLEGALKVRLFERIAGRLTLSDAGRVLLPHAERVAAALRDAAEAVADLRNAGAGPLAIAAVGTPRGQRTDRRAEAICRRTSQDRR
jgi:DNA-binding transcriptional LysR family regulator